MAEPVPARLAPFCFTPSAAVIAGKRSGEARRARAAARLAALNAPPAPTPPLPPDAVPAAVNAQLALVAAQIRNTCAVLDRVAPHHCRHCGKPSGAVLDMEPHHRAALLRALDSLLDRQRVLLGIPMPGSLKPSSPRPGARRGNQDPASFRAEETGTSPGPAAPSAPGAG